MEKPRSSPAAGHYTLLLTLGALAEIEDGLGLDDLSQVSARLKTVRAAISPSWRRLCCAAAATT